VTRCVFTSLSLVACYEGHQLIEVSDNYLYELYVILSHVLLIAVMETDADKRKDETTGDDGRAESSQVLSDDITV